MPRGLQPRLRNLSDTSRCVTTRCLWQAFRAEANARLMTPSDTTRTMREDYAAQMEVGIHNQVSHGTGLHMYERAFAYGDWAFNNLDEIDSNEEDMFFAIHFMRAVHSFEIQTEKQHAAFVQYLSRLFQDFVKIVRPTG
ncbi:hypothetical protein BD309DRAFT_1070562 [Dichomitus squalens]|nr:hypothetical protein BD309DRAFT_1070562 [Dichomitus squalens]